MRGSNQPLRLKSVMWMVRRTYNHESWGLRELYKYVVSTCTSKAYTVRTQVKGLTAHLSASVSVS